MLSNSGVVFVGMTIGNIFSYLFNMTMGRMLGPVDYGELTLLLSFFTLASVACGAITTIIMRYSGELFFSKLYGALNKFYNFMIKNVAIMATALAFMVLILAKPIANFFSISNWVNILPIIGAIICIFLLTVNKGLLQGMQRFASVSFLGAFEYILRFALALSFVTVGWKLFGAMFGLSLATVFAYIASIWLIRKLNLTNLAKADKSSVSFNKKEMISYGMPVLISSIMLALSLNMDIFLVKRYFSAEEAGLYAAISVIAKIILYVGSPIISVMFPMISEQRAKGEKHYQIFFFSLILTLLLSLMVLGVYSLAPGTVIKILYGTKYITFYYLLPQIGLAFLFYSLINLMTNYYMAIKNFVFVWFYLITIVMQIVAVTLWHSELLIVIRIFVLSFAFLFALMTGYYVLIKQKQIKSYIMGRDEQ